MLLFSAKLSFASSGLYTSNPYKPIQAILALENFHSREARVLAAVCFLPSWTWLGDAHIQSHSLQRGWNDCGSRDSFQVTRYPLASARWVVGDTPATDTPRVTNAELPHPPKRPLCHGDVVPVRQPAHSTFQHTERSQQLGFLEQS